MEPDELTIEWSLQRWGAEKRSRAPLVTFVPPPKKPSWASGWLRPSLVAAVLVLLLGAVTAAVVNTPGRHGVRSVAVSLSAPPPVLPGTQTVNFHGLALGVPSSWTLNQRGCEEPIGDTVLLPGIHAACLVPFAEGKSTVEFHLAGGGYRPFVDYPGLSQQATAIDGTPAVEVLGTDDSSPQSALIGYEIPALAAAVLIRAPDQESASALAAGLHIDTADANGCPSQVDDIATIPTGMLPTRDGGDQTLIPSTPLRITVCRYAYMRIEQSGVVGDVPEFTSALNALPRDLSQVATPFQADCRATDANPSNPASPPDNDWEAYRIVAEYESGPPLVAVARLGACGLLGISNGSVTGQLTERLSRELIATAGIAHVVTYDLIVVPS